MFLFLYAEISDAITLVHSTGILHNKFYLKIVPDANCTNPSSSFISGTFETMSTYY